MTTSSPKPKTRTITLTDRPPVRVNEADWPLVASATGDSWGTSGDYCRHEQAHSLRVRRHEDGRALVYGVLDAAGPWTGSESRKGGVLLEAGSSAAELVSAIREVGADVGIPESLIRECVADLPAEQL